MDSPSHVVTQPALNFLSLQHGRSHVHCPLGRKGIWGRRGGPSSRRRAPFSAEAAAGLWTAAVGTSLVQSSPCCCLKHEEAPLSTCLTTHDNNNNNDKTNAFVILSISHPCPSDAGCCTCQPSQVLHSWASPLALCWWRLQLPWRLLWQAPFFHRPAPICCGRHQGAEGCVCEAD